MNIIIIDENQQELLHLQDLVRSLRPDAAIALFHEAEAALSHLLLNDCDVLLLDAAMKGISGAELYRRVRLRSKHVNAIFMAEDPAALADTLTLHASGYLKKPVTMSMLRAELDDLRYSTREERGTVRRAKAQCFGNFEFFVDDCPVKFKYKKTKEMLAYLIDRCGAVCTGPEIITTLFEDDEEHTAYYKSLVRDLAGTLDSLGVGNILVKQWGGIGIRTDLIACDYYNWKRGMVDGINTYRGEYMSQYSWGEFTNAGQLGRAGYMGN